jgi:hypothetical protein
VCLERRKERKGERGTVAGHFNRRDSGERKRRGFGLGRATQQEELGKVVGDQRSDRAARGGRD